MAEEWWFQWSGKDKSGAMLNVRANSAGELRDRLGDLFGLGADEAILAGFSPVGNVVQGLAESQPSRAVENVRAAFPGSEVVAPLASEGATCPRCEVGTLRLRNGKRGKFYGCSNFPTCKHSQDA